MTLLRKTAQKCRVDERRLEIEVEVEGLRGVSFLPAFLACVAEHENCDFSPDNPGTPKQNQQWNPRNREQCCNVARQLAIG